MDGKENAARSRSKRKTKSEADWLGQEVHVGNCGVEECPWFTPQRPHPSTHKRLTESLATGENDKNVWARSMACLTAGKCEVCSPVLAATVMRPSPPRSVRPCCPAS